MSNDQDTPRPPLKERLRSAFRRDEEGGRPPARKLLLAAGVLAGLGVLAFAALWLNCGVRGCPDVDLLRGYVPDEASIIVDRDGEEVTKLFRVKRTVIPIDSLPEHVPQAFIAIEDQRFFDHGGVDWRRMVGAGISTVRSVVGMGGDLEGGSTITMQMAGNLFPERLDRSERTVWRKIGEMRLAGEIEDEYTKAEILELYLNQIYFGSSAWGIEAAAQEYFGKSATELDLAEAALLAGLPKAPSRLNPRADAEASRERRNLVLERMAEQGMVSAEEAEQARESEIQLARGKTAAEEAVGAYFVEAVRRQLEDELGADIYTQGYTIHTTMDLDAQRAMEEELERQLRNVEAGAYGRFRHAAYDPEGEAGSGSEYLQGAGVLMDATAGDVIALVGGRDFKQSQYNRAIQAMRQPGSAFKPFVYATALERGYPTTYPLEDSPLRLELDRGRQVWEPKNYGNSYAGMIPLREALVNSKNTATVRLAQQVGVSSVIETARQAGIDGELPDYPAVVLGAGAVTPLDLTAAYTVFATLGETVEPRFVTRVEDRDGRAVWASDIQRRRAMDPAVAFLVNDILQDVVNRGTATAVRGVGYRGAVAGKTGTTNEGTDVWFVGATPEMVAGFWIGFDDPKTITSGATGGGFAAPIWGRLMRRIDGGRGTWSPPPGVVQRLVDARGNIVGEGCPTGGGTREEWFLSSTAPVGDCYGGYYAYSDTLGTDSLMARMDSLRAADQRWWDRLRGRLFGDEAEDSLRRERDRILAERMDTLRRVPLDSLPRDTAAPSRPDTAKRDTTKLLGKPVKPDTTPPPPPPDTSGASPAARPDSTGGRPPR